MKKLAKVVLFAALISSLLALAGCGQAEEAAQNEAEAPAQEAPAQELAPVTFTDDLGNEVTVENPQRVVACMGSFADMWQLAGGTLVGASSDAFADYGIDAEKVEAVGDFSQPDMESIMALDPDFVLMTCAEGGRGGVNAQVGMRDALVESGINVAYFEITTFDDYKRMMRTLCDITGRDDLYETNVVEVEKDIETIVEGGHVGEEADVHAAILTTFSQGMRVQPAEGMTGSMVDAFGVKNIANENRSLLKDFSMEALIEADPEVIYVLPMGNDKASADDNLAAATTDNPAWSTLTAVQNDKVIVLDPALFMYKPNDQWADAYQIIAETLKDVQ